MLAPRLVATIAMVAFAAASALAQTANFVPLPSANNVPMGLRTAPGGAVPFLGNAAFSLSVDNPTGICPITLGSPTAVVFASSNSPPLPLPGYGCMPGQPGDVLFAPASYISTEIVGAWTGPGTTVLPMPIPAATALCGATIVTQGVFVDLAGQNGISLTEALLLRLGVDPNAASPSNDDCFTASPITNGVTAGTNAGATTGTAIVSCGSMGNEVWYSYVAPCNGLATFSLCPGNGGSATFDSVLAVFDASAGKSPPTSTEGFPVCSFVEIACNDDVCGTASEVTVTVLQGQNLLIAVGGFQGLRGCFSLSVSCQ